MGRNIRVSGLSPGLVETEFAEVMKGKEDAEKTYSQFDCLQASDMAESVKYIMSAPKHVQVHDILVRPTKQKF